jgi:hypothetical protein
MVMDDGRGLIPLQSLSYCRSCVERVLRTDSLADELRLTRLIDRWSLKDPFAAQMDQSSKDVTTRSSGNHFISRLPVIRVDAGRMQSHSGIREVSLTGEESVEQVSSREVHVKSFRASKQG